ncbi:putative tetratricopeptide-like helical domain superfamily [Helianthus annuus]|nr:putative tetratricopeptide-like helical domain superfamily [Helianthus annuus]
MLFNLQRSTHFKKVSHLFPLFFIKHHCSSTPCNNKQPQSNPHINTTSINLSSLTTSILTKCSNLLTKPPHPTTPSPSVQQYLLDVSYINPRVTRKFWRKSEFQPQDVLELLLGFQSNSEKLGVDAKKVASLFKIFKWVGSRIEKGTSFKHLDQSFKVMIQLLVRVGLFKDAEWVVLEMGKEGILLDDQQVYSSLIEWYVGVDELEKSVDMYDRMRGLNLVPSLSCYRTLVNYLVHRDESKLCFRVCGDMLDMGMAEKETYEKVVRVLCRVGNVLESRNLIKKAYVYGIKPSLLLLDAIASGYCEKKDYDDLMSLFIEMDCFPDVTVGNKIIHSICQDLGVKKAFEFLNEFERLGYTPDAITFGILIGWSCKEGHLKNALFYLSNVLSRGLKPHKNSYNAIISAVFKHGMWNHANDIVLEMEDEGVTLDTSTFRVLLAGYCYNRRFDEVKVIVEKMAQKGSIEHSPLQDPISKAFLLLGIDPSVLKVRRDNDVAFSKTEFYDSAGNGLYLDGDVVDFDQTMINVLDDAMVPDYNRIILNDAGLATIDELVHWGQELLVSGFSTQLKKFHASNSGFKTLTTFLEKTPNLHDNLDEETLNLLVQAYAKRGFVHKSKEIFDKMVKKKVVITKETYSALVKGLCKKGNSSDIRECCDFIRNKNWLPTLNDYRTLIDSLCKNNMVVESLSLFEHAMTDYPHEVTEIFYGFLENLCGIGFTKTARFLFHELLERGYRLDQVAYSHLLSGLCKENRFSEAFVMSNTMLARITTPNVDVYNVLLHGYCAVNDLTKAKEVFGAILKKNITIYTSSYSKFVSLMCNDGRYRFAFSLKDLMVKQSSSHIDITLYNILMFHLFASKNSVFVDTILDEIQEKRLEFDDVTYNFLVYGFSNCESGSRSVYYLTEMMSKDLKPSNRSLRAVVRSLLEDNKFTEVLKLSREMETKRWVHCSIVQNVIVTCFLNMGKLQEAVKFLENMIRKDLVPDNVNYDNLIKKMCHHGRNDTASDLLDSMLMKANIPDSTTYDRLIQDLSVCNKIDDALDLYTEMLNHKLAPSIKTYEVLTETLCECGRTLEGEKLIDGMIRAGEQPSKGMFGSVVSRYRFERNFTKASELLQRMQQFGYKPDFETHWSLISTLSRLSDRDIDDNSSNFLSKLLSESGFKPKKDVDRKSK